MFRKGETIQSKRFCEHGLMIDDL